MEQCISSPSALTATSGPTITSSNASHQSSRRDNLAHPQAGRYAGLVPGLVVTCLLCLAGPVTRGQEFVPFAIPLRLDPAQAIWMADYQPITAGSERIVAREGHFYQGDRRVRIWGVNLSFGANFPTHEDAPLVAGRLAASGVNSVRFHHMDTAQWPRGIWNARDGKTLEPQALDRLDFFIHELAKRGIWSNINLHVGRKHSRYLGMPDSDSDYDKVANLFTPRLVQAQRQFAKDLLSRVNPYRNVRYADDPAVAFVEITNENSFFMWDGEQRLRRLPPYYADILRGQFSEWLATRYGSEEALRTAWAKGTQPLGETMLRNGSLVSWDRSRNLPEHWNLEQHDGSKAAVVRPQNSDRDAIQVEIAKADGAEWHLQLTQGGFPLTGGQYYTVSFEAAGHQPRAITCSVGQAHSPWGNLGLSRRVELTPQWRTFRFGFIATADDHNARISFAFGGDPTAFRLANIKLQPGGQVGLAPDESLASGNVVLFRDYESTPRILDRMMFLAQAEKAFFDGMRSYIQANLGCGALVTGTIVFGPLGLYGQSDMDFIDGHAYWQHPRFPGRPWDAGNWIVEQRAMTDYPAQATLFRLAGERLGGKPFTVSEYNHPAPLDAQAACVPMMASFAAAQDWDGVWFYTYSHSGDDWDRRHLNSYFDIDTNPAKWGFMRAGAAVFRDGAISRLPHPTFYSPTQGDDMVKELAELHIRHGSNMFAVASARAGVNVTRLLEGRWIALLGGRHAQGEITVPGTELRWTVENGKGLYAARSRSAWVYAGHAGRFDAASGGRITVSGPQFVALTITPLGTREKLLVTACGRCENTGMQFSEDRRTVGRNWGTAPVRIEAVQGTVALPEGKWTCWALAPDGKPGQQVPIRYENGQGVLALSPEYETMWYLLERKSKVIESR
jgi:hypothetical protein